MSTRTNAPRTEIGAAQSAPEHCPFCGEIDELRCILREAARTMYYVWCKSCDAQGPTAATKPEAWELWNERV